MNGRKQHKEQLERLKWLAEHPGKAALRDRLDRLQKSAEKAADPTLTARTRNKHAAIVCSSLEAWQANERPEERELVVLLRTMCLMGFAGVDGVRVGVRGGSANESLPTDPEIVSKLVMMALSSLPPVRNGCPPTAVNAWTIHMAADKNLDRRALERVVGEGKDVRAGKRSMRNTSTERTVTSLKRFGFCADTPLGRVAGVLKRPPKEKPSKN